MWWEEEVSKEGHLGILLPQRVQCIATSIAPPNMEANNFELKPTLISIVQQSQFVGRSELTHLGLFRGVWHIEAQQSLYDVIRLRLFPFQLRGKARAWLHSLPPRCITTWDELTRAFLTKFFPPSKTASLRNQITNSIQKDERHSIRLGSGSKTCCGCALTMAFNDGWLFKLSTMEWHNMQDPLLMQQQGEP